MSKWITKFIEHRNAFAGLMDIPVMVPIGREKVCNCGGKLLAPGDELCPECALNADAHCGELVVPRIFGSTHLGIGWIGASPLGANRCRYCGTKNPCSTDRCPNCGAHNS